MKPRWDKDKRVAYPAIDFNCTSHMCFCISSHLFYTSENYTGKCLHVTRSLHCHLQMLAEREKERSNMKIIQSFIESFCFYSICLFTVLFITFCPLHAPSNPSCVLYTEMKLIRWFIETLWCWSQMHFYHATIRIAPAENPKEKLHLVLKMLRNVERCCMYL